MSNLDFPSRQLVSFVEEPSRFQFVINDITRLIRYPLVNLFKPSRKENAVIVADNEELWRLFRGERIFDTARVILQHFHLFEWFPIAPGKFYTPESQRYRNEAMGFTYRTPEGNIIYDPYGKAIMMFEGGIGTVRIRPRIVNNTPYYFMSASSNGICHEGFPVFVPRDYYSLVKPIMNQLGAVPVTISGEMRYLYEPLPSFFEGRPDMPTLYLYVDTLKILPEPRDQVSKFEVSVGVSFMGEFEGKDGVYATYATFDPGNIDSLERAVNWMGKYYITERYKGVVITDFDEVKPRFPGTVFGLPELMAGNLNQDQVANFLIKHGFDPGAGKKFYVFYKEINTHGGAYIEGDVDTGGGGFTGRDQIVSGPSTSH